MKYIFVVIAIILLSLLALGAYCTINTNKLIHSITSGNEQAFQNHFKRTDICAFKIKYYKQIPNILNSNYLILLQNNYEIRPTGGFMGSYALITFKNGVLKDWQVNDIYTPDGQIEGHVPPKAPLQQAFKHGEWRLPNSNWEPNYPDAAEDILWFFEKAGIKNIDGVIAVNFEFIKKWVGIIGDIKPLDYEEMLNEDNFYFLTQSYSQENFFPGSHAKKNYLSSAGNSLITKTQESSVLTKIQLAKLIKTQLDEKQILIWHKDKDIISLIEEGGYSGSLGDYKYDYFYSVESNLGSNKSNYCVERHIYQDVNINEKVDNSTTITITNGKDECINTKVQKWMGEYINYQRVIIPYSAQIEIVGVNGINYTLENDIDPDNPPDYRNDHTYSIVDKGMFKEVGFWVFVPIQESGTFTVNYSLPILKESEYTIYVKRQPGIYKIPYKLTINGNTIVDFILTKDEEFKSNLR